MCIKLLIEIVTESRIMDDLYKKLFFRMFICSNCIFSYIIQVFHNFIIEAKY